MSLLSFRVRFTWGTFSAHLSLSVCSDLCMHETCAPSGAALPRRTFYYWKNFLPLRYWSPDSAACHRQVRDPVYKCLSCRSSVELLLLCLGWISSRSGFLLPYLLSSFCKRGWIIFNLDV